MFEFLYKLFDSDFMPHGHCYYWAPSILWTTVISDTIIALSYFTIPVALFVFVKKRNDISFNWIFVLFAIFIFACGATHVMEIWNIWHGTYRLSALIKVITAVASIFTAIAIWPLLPKLLKIPSSKQLKEANDLLQFNIQKATSDLQKTLIERDNLLILESQARKQAEKVNQIKDEFLETLSHELRTPLNAIISWLQVLQSNQSQFGSSSDAFSALKRNTKHLSLMIEDLIIMSSILSGSVNLSLSECDIQSICTRSIDAVKQIANSRGIIITEHHSGVQSKFNADSLRIKQIIWHLLLNALKFSPNNSHITLSTKTDNASITCVVKDSGKGISPDFLPFVFDRFSQENQSITREHQGLGLGLSIAKHLTELHGGTLTVYSKGKDMGSIFTLTIPINK